MLIPLGSGKYCKIFEYLSLIFVVEDVLCNGVLLCGLGSPLTYHVLASPACGPIQYLFHVCTTHVPLESQREKEYFKVCHSVDTCEVISSNKIMD